MGRHQLFPNYLRMRSVETWRAGTSCFLIICVCALRSVETWRAGTNCFLIICACAVWRPGGLAPAVSASLPRSTSSSSQLPTPLAPSPPPPPPQSGRPSVVARVHVTRKKDFLKINFLNFNAV